MIIVETRNQQLRIIAIKTMKYCNINYEIQLQHGYKFKVKLESKGQLHYGYFQCRVAYF